MPTAGELLRRTAGYFNKDDVRDNPMTLTIKDVVSEEVGLEKDIKDVIEFEEVPRKLVLNVTRTRQLSELFGTQREIKGQKVELHLDSPLVRGKPVEQVCLRDPEAVA